MRGVFLSVTVGLCVGQGWVGSVDLDFLAHPQRMFCLIYWFPHKIPTSRKSPQVSWGRGISLQSGRATKSRNKNYSRDNPDLLIIILSKVYQGMASTCHEPPAQVNPTGTCSRCPLLEGTQLSGRPEPAAEKHNISNANLDDDLLEEELIKKKNENKLRYRRLKQKLATLCGEHQDKCLTKVNKEVSSPNKSRLLTLAIEFEKMTLNQTKDYAAIENKLREIIKILDLKKQHDLFILRLSRFVPAFSGFLKKVPTFHKSQFNQSTKTVELGLKLMRVFCTLSANRDYLIATNQLSNLNSCLNSFIAKEEKKLALECLTVLHELLSSKVKADLEQIVSITLQIVFFGQLARRLRQGIESCITEDGIADEQYAIKSLKYLHILYRKCFEKYLERPVYQQPQMPQLMQYHLDGLVAQLEHMLPLLLLDKDDQSLREEELPVCHINITLYILKLVNLCLHVSYRNCQKVLQISSSSQFWVAVTHLFEYSRHNLEHSTGIYELNCLYTEIVDMLGKLCCECDENRKSLYSTTLLEMLCNHPLVYIMDPKLKSHLIPSLCAVMDGCEPNMKKYLGENSSENIISYVETQKKKYEDVQILYFDDNLKEVDMLEDDEEDTHQDEKGSNRILNRKESVSSFNSYTTQCTQGSYFPLQEEDRNAAGLFSLVPCSHWDGLIQALRNLDS